MTLGGIAAAIGLVIDDAIVVVEAIYAKCATGLPRIEAIQSAIGEIFRPLVGSTLTPVVVFIPLAFLDGITGVFFRALALTMVVSLLTSLVLAVTLTPSLAAWFIRDGGPREHGRAPGDDEGGFVLRRVIGLYEIAVRTALRYRWLTLLGCGLVLGAGIVLYENLESDFLPPMDEGGFIIDYHSPYGTSLEETNRQLLAGRGDSPRHARGGRLFAAHRRAPRAVHRRAEHRRFPGQAQARPAAAHPGRDRRAARRVPRRHTRHRMGISRAFSPTSSAISPGRRSRSK